MRGLAVDIEAVEIKAAGDDALLDGELAVMVRRCGVHVQGDDRIDMRVLHAAVLDHVHCAASGVTRARGFLGGLEDELHAAGELVSVFAEDARGGEQDGDVHIVAAGVHNALVLGRELNAGLLGHRQSVHIGADGDALALALAALYQRDEAGHPCALDRVDAVFLQLLHNESAGSLFFIRKLRMAVDILADGFHFGIVFFDCFFEHYWFPPISFTVVEYIPFV